MKIEQPFFAPRSHPPRFNEGAGGLAQRITTLAVTLMAALASFVFLPVKVAVCITGFLGLINLLSCCISDNVPQEERRWYHYVVYAVPRAINHVFTTRHPVVNAGPRVPVGRANPLTDVPVVRPGPRVPVGRADPLADVPVVHPGPRVPVGRANQPTTIPVVHPGPRVPVGRNLPGAVPVLPDVPEGHSVRRVPVGRRSP